MATKTIPAPRKRVIKKAAATPAPKATAPVKAAPKAAKPTTVKHDFASAWTGESDGVNRRISRTQIDASRFGSRANDPLTERDRKNLETFRSQFGNKAFQRSNLDAGILRRLGERGYIAHVSGAGNEATATYKLTGKKAA